MQSVCSSKNNSLLRKSVMALNLKEFEDELRTKAPVTNDLFLDMLCTSSPQKKHKLSVSSEVSETKAERATSVQLTVASMILYCRCPQLAALSTRIGLIVRDFGSGRMVSSFFFINYVYRQNKINVKRPEPAPKLFQGEYCRL